MTTDITEEKKPAHKGKKRYLAIAALASLVATGGLIGATVIKTSAIEGNSINIVDAIPDVEATGTPLTVKFVRGEAPDPKEIGLGTITFTNTGNAPAMIAPQPVEGLALKAKPGATGKDLTAQLAVQIAGVSSPSWTQSIGPSSAANLKGTVAVVPGKPVTVNVFLTAAGGKATWDQFDVFEKSFDLKFDYVSDK